MAMQISIPTPTKRNSDLGTVTMGERLRPLGAGQRSNLYTLLRNEACRWSEANPRLVGLDPAEPPPSPPINTARVVAWGAWLVLFAALAGPWLAQKLS